MSTLAQGNPTSRGVEDDILVPLLARLTTIKAFLDAAAAATATATPPLSATATDPNASQSQEPVASQDASGDVRFQARELLNKIEREMAALRGLLRRIDNIEKSMRHRFDPVEQHIDDALLELHLDDALHDHVNRVHAELSAVDAEIEDIMAKIRKSYIVPSTEGDAGRNAPAGVPSPPVAMVKTKKMAEIQRSPQMRHLSLVIGGLEARVRGCVLCLAVFPEGAVIKKRLLIHWWIGEGFVESADAGKKRFDELIAKGFVIPVPSALCSTVHRCKVRPWMRDLLIDVARSNAFFEEDSNNFTLARRACLQSRKVRSAFCAEVRTIYNINQKYVELDEQWFMGKKELCTLQLGQWREFGPRDQIANPIVSHIEVSGVERFADVESCKNLRYISFRGMSRIESLPDSVGKLRELVVLDLRACHNLEDLGEGITKLDKLEYLDLSECHLLVGMPKGLGRLRRLEVLKGFVIANTNSKDPCHLNELTKLEKLRKLGIVIGKLAVPTEDEFLKLSDFKALESLTIRWGVQRVHTTELEKSNNEEDAASHLVTTMKLPPNLKKLDLHCFPLPGFPQWVPKGVKKLYIRGGKLATLGEEEGWEVEVLRLRFLSDLEYSHARLQHFFKTLKPGSTEIHECPKFMAEQ